MYFSFIHDIGITQINKENDANGVIQVSGILGPTNNTKIFVTDVINPKTPADIDGEIGKVNSTPNSNQIGSETPEKIHGER